LASADYVKVKGLGFEGVVAALKPSFEKQSELVPEALQHYMVEPIDAAGWYPLPHYLALMRVLASTIDPVKAKGDVYRAFGVIAAQRDVFGVQPNVPREQQPTTVASFQGALRGVTGLASLVKRALHLRERYYSHGYYTVKRVAERKLEVTLLEFPVCAELCAVSTGYLTHMMRSANVGAWVERISCCGNGDASCRWEIKFADATDVKDLAIFGDSLPVSTEETAGRNSLPSRRERKSVDESVPVKKEPVVRSDRVSGANHGPPARDEDTGLRTIPPPRPERPAPDAERAATRNSALNTLPVPRDRKPDVASVPAKQDSRPATAGTPVWRRRKGG
jgi:hypothetical protein